MIHASSASALAAMLIFNGSMHVSASSASYLRTTKEAPSFLSAIPRNLGSTCKDTSTFSFSIGSGLEATCADIGGVVGVVNVPANRWCSPNQVDNVIDECPSACGLCTCVDNPNFTFQNVLENPPTQEGCNFLSDAGPTQGVRSQRLKKYCDPSTIFYVGDKCPASCGKCTQPTSAYCADGYQSLPPNPAVLNNGAFLRRTQYRSNEFDACYLEYFETPTGYVLISGPNVRGNFAEVDDETGEFLDTGLSFPGDDPTNAVIKYGPRAGLLIRKNVIEIAKSILEKKELGRRGRGLSLVAKSNGKPSNRRQAVTTGVIKTLVVPIRFAGAGAAVVPRADLDTIFNGPCGPGIARCTEGSVRDFFNENSFGKATVIASVVGEITLSDEKLTEEYCAGFKSTDPSKRDRTQLWRCLRNALDQVKILLDNNNVAATGLPSNTKFSDFDTNGDGVIDSIVFIHGGEDEASRGPDNTDPVIWSHTWEMDDAWTSSDDGGNVEVGRYTIASGFAIGADTQLGKLTYGLASLLGAESLSDGDGDGSGLGNYDVMANPYGALAALEVPPQMSAYTKMKLGWITPVNVSGPVSNADYELRQACTSGDALKITAGFPAGEYLLVENRQTCGFDAGLPVPAGITGGVAIYHVDQSRTGIDASVQGFPQGGGTWPGDGKHYRVALLQADGKYELERDVETAAGNDGDATDLFRAGGVNSIGPAGTSDGASFPNTATYQSGIIKGSGVTISDIGAAAQTMRVVVNVVSTSAVSGGGGGGTPSGGGNGSATGSTPSAAVAGGLSAGSSAGMISGIVVGSVLVMIGAAYFIGRKNGRFVRKHEAKEYGAAEESDENESESERNVVFPVKGLVEAEAVEAIAVKEEVEIQQKAGGGYFSSWMK